MKSNNQLKYSNNAAFSHFHDAVVNNLGLIIKDEKLWSKDGAKIKTKKSLFDFAEVDLREKRDKNEQYLMDDVSIIVAENKKKNMCLFISNMLEWTDHNILNVLGRFPKELLTFLDPSIEYLECSLKEKK